MFSIDTVNPRSRANTSAEPRYTPTQALLWTVTDAHLGADNFTLLLTYDHDMNFGYTPTITMVGELPGDAGVSSTLQRDDANSFWLNNRTFRGKYNVVDNNIYISHVDVTVTGVYDAVGNLQNPGFFPDLFSINTAIATPPGPITVTSVTSNLAKITDANVGTDTFRLDVYYSAATVGNTPTIKFSPDISSTLTFDYGFWIDPQYTHYRAVYSVADANVIVNPIGIKIEGARDTSASHYDQAFYVATAPFTIDTLNPPGAQPRVPVGRISNPSYTDAVLSSGALNLRIGTPSAPDEPEGRSQPGRSGLGLDRDVAGRVRGQGSRVARTEGGVKSQMQRQDVRRA